MLSSSSLVLLWLIDVYLFYLFKMAAQTHAATALCPNRTVFPCLFCCFLQKRSYSRELLLKINRSKSTNFSHMEELQITLRNCGLLQGHLPSATPAARSHPQWKRLRWCGRKRGKHGAVWSRLAAKPHKPVIPTIVLSNVHSLDNKLDRVRLLRSTLK